MAIVSPSLARRTPREKTRKGNPEEARDYAAKYLSRGNEA
jgi:hypothetical protein